MSNRLDGDCFGHLSELYADHGVVVICEGFSDELVADYAALLILHHLLE